MLGVINLMPIHRVFMNWDRPGLVAAAEYLARDFGSRGMLDMAGVIVAVPGGRAGRRLLEILVQQAEDQKSVLTPPRIVTVGRLPELLYETRKLFAGELTQQLAWVEALKGSKPELLRRLSSVLPADDDLGAWLALAETIARLHRELAADALDCSAVANYGSQVDGFQESERWQALAAIQQDYLRTLDRFDLWDMQTARLYAIREGECRTEAQIVLVGAVDLNRTQRMMLDQVANHVTSLIVAPPELAASFDEHGCLRPEAWLERPVPLTTDQIDIVDDPADQSEAVVHAIAAMNEQYRAEQISIGVPNEAIVPYIEQHLRQCEISARYGVGRPLTGSSPGRLLDAVANFLESSRFMGFAALVRHPAMQHWLTAKAIKDNWLSELDEYYSEHLPYAMGDEWLGSEKYYQAIRQVEGEICRLLQCLRGPVRPLGQWGDPIIALLVDIFGQAQLDPTTEVDYTVIAACEKIHNVLREHTSVPDVLAPTISGAEAIRLALEQLAGETIAPPPDHNAIELLGWLELPLDDAPALVVTVMNEGCVPSSLNGDLFLPNQLRRALGIEDNDRRYARDAYAMSTLVASRQFLRIIVGRRNTDGDPMMPSRLLFACDEETVARRVMAFCSTTEAMGGKPVPAGVLQPGRPQSQFEIPTTRPLTNSVTSMRVTEFKDYLGCPYRYYLRHQLKLEALRDSGEELDGSSFGTLAHLVLHEFGKSTVAVSTDPEEIAHYLDEELDRQLSQCFGRSPLSAICVQVEQLRLRLREFARWQADWAKQGWIIEHVETFPKDGAAKIMVDGKPMFLRGRIDRIDFQPSTGKRMIIDYKSSDTPSTPEKSHRRKNDWVDLQLPLYRHLAIGMGINGPFELAYIALPKDTSQTGIMISEWTPEDLQSADEAAAVVVRNVRAEKFWPPTTPPPDFSEDFAPICLDGQFRAILAAEVDHGGIES
jgi:ATP-dependent helicase/nuclease subunit B